MLLLAPLLGVPDLSINPPLHVSSSNEDIQDEDVEEIEWEP
jgi:hypothetical protein